MTIYSVFQPVDDPAPGAVTVIADRFSWFAFLLPPLFLGVHRAWRALLGLVAASLAIILAGVVFGGDVGFWLYVLLALWTGFEAPTLRRAALKRRGYAYQTDVIASAPDLAQVEWLKRRRIVSA